MENREPGKNSNDSAPDEEVIELTEIVAASDDDEIIELSEIVESSEEEADTVIELTETVDDEVIDLTSPIEEETGMDEDIIELTDVAETEIAIELTDSVDSTDTQAAVIELTEDVPPAAVVADTGEPDISIDLEEDTLYLEETVEEDVTDATLSDEDAEKTLDLLDTLETGDIARFVGELEPTEIPDAEQLETVEFIAARDADTEAGAADEPAEPEKVEAAEEEIHEDLDDIQDLAELSEIAAVLEEDLGVETLEPEDADLDLAGIEEDLLEPDEEIDIPGEDQTAQDLELEKSFSDSLETDIGSVLTATQQDELEKSIGEKTLDRPGVVTVQVTDKREKGTPIDFRFESRVHPGDKIVRESEGFSNEDMVSKEKVEAVIEKVVKDLLAEKIDALLTDTIEKAVHTEIQKIKSILMEDSDLQAD